MRVLLIGETADTADLTDPAIPPGLTAEKIQAGIEGTLADMRGRGWRAVYCAVPPAPAKRPRACRRRSPPRPSTSP